MPDSSDAPLTADQLSGWLYADASLERLEFARLSALAATRPDLAPLIELLLEGYHRRAATSYKMSAYYHSSGRPSLPALAPSAPEIPRALPGWWERVRVAWKVLFPGP